MRRIIFCWFIAAFLTSCNSFKIGETEVTISKNESEILIDNFPKPRYGIEGFNTITWPEGFSFDKLDGRIFKVLQAGGFKSNRVFLKVRVHNTDNYGAIVKSNWRTIGSYDVLETQKFEDYRRWENRYGVYRLMEKSGIDIYSK